MIGEVLSSYRVLEKLGEGGMGVVFVAEHTLIGRRAAIKLLHPEMSRNQEIVQRFFNEARAATLIRHPGIVDISDFGWHPSGCAYFVMELLDGESLAARIKRTRVIEPSLLVALAEQIATALAAAHAKGIIHRDLKPDNVFLVPDRAASCGIRVKVLDFGIAKLATDGPAASQTRTGSVMGTPLYMSPEQCRGAGQVDARSDVYSLGCILYEMAVGQPPFLGEGVGEILGKHQFLPVVPPRQVNPACPPSLAALIEAMLAKDPGARPQTMQEVEAALERLGIPAPTRHSGNVSAPSVPTAASTTLGSAAAEVATPPPRRGWAIPTVLGGILVAGGAVVALVASSGPARQEAAIVAPADAVVAVVTAPDAAVAVVVPPDAAVAVVVPPDAAVAVVAPPDAAVTVAVARPPEKRPPHPPPARPPPPREEAPPPPPTAGVDALVAESRDALRKGQWAAANRKADEALDASPGNADALALAAMASCKLGKVDKASSYVARIKGQRQMMVRQFCGNSGVILP